MTLEPYSIYLVIGRLPYKKLPDTKELLNELDSIQEKKNTLMKEYSESKTNMDDLFVIRKNFEQYMGKEMER